MALETIGTPKTDTEKKQDQGRGRFEGEVTGRFNYEGRGLDADIIPDLDNDRHKDWGLTKEYTRQFTVRGAAEQFGIGFLNQLMLGYPLYAIENHMELGPEIIKQLESPVEAERTIRGIGSFLGFTVGLPSKVFKAGAKGAALLQKAVSAKRVNRFVAAAAKGASVAGLYELVKAPEEDFGEKVKKVPLAIAAGAVLGAAGERLSTAIKIRTLDKVKALGGAETNRIVEAFKKRSMLHNTLLTSTGRYLNRLGSVGQSITKRMNMSRKQYEIQRNSRWEEFRTLVKSDGKELTFQESNNLRGVIENDKVLPMNKKVTELSTWWKKMTGKDGILAKEARKAGVKVKTEFGLQEFDDMLIDNYFPHMMVGPQSTKAAIQQTLRAAVDRGDFKDMKHANHAFNEWTALLEKGKQSSTLAKYLVRTGKAKDIKEANIILLDIASKSKQTRFSNLEYARKVGLPFYDPNPERAIIRYLDGFYERVEKIKAFGQENEVGADLIMQLKEKGLDYKTAETAINRFLGMEEQTMTGVSQVFLAKIRAYNTATKLGLAVIPNASQSINTAIVTGIKNTFRGMKAMTTKEGKRLAYIVSNIGEGTMHNLSGELTGSQNKWATRVLKWTGFSALEKLNRGIAANAGREYALRLSKQLLKTPHDRKLIRALSEIGLNPSQIIKQGGLDADDIVNAAYEIVNKTQFRAGVQDLPLFFTQPEGKVVTQFKNFSYNQTKLIKDAILQEAARGNLKPMIRAVSLAPFLGEGVKDIRALLSGTKRDEKGKARIAENMAAVGSFGIFMDLWQSASYGKWLGAVMGPTAATAADLVEGSVKAAMGEPNKLLRFTARQVPTAGPLLSNLLKSKKATGKLGIKPKRKKMGVK